MIMAKDDVGFTIRRINNALRRRAEESEVLKQVPNMSMVNGWMIILLDEKERLGERMCQSSLEPELGITKSAISRNLKLMEQKGLITQVRDENDARKRYLALTDKSRDMARAMELDGEQAEAQLLAGFSQEEIEQLKNYLGRLIANLEGTGGTEY